MNPIDNFRKPIRALYNPDKQWIEVRSDGVTVNKEGDLCFTPAQAEELSSDLASALKSSLDSPFERWWREAEHPAGRPDLVKVGEHMTLHRREAQELMANMSKYHP